MILPVTALFIDDDDGKLHLAKGLKVSRCRVESHDALVVDQ